MVEQARAITAAIGAVALADADQVPMEFDTHRDGAQKIKCYLPKLYEAWGLKPDLVAEGEMTIDFLQTNDIVYHPNPWWYRLFACSEYLPLKSLLNSRLLDEIAKAGIDVEHVRYTAPLYFEKFAYIHDVVEPSRHSLFDSIR